MSTFYNPMWRAHSQICAVTEADGSAQDITIIGGSCGNSARVPVEGEDHTTFPGLRGRLSGERDGRDEGGEEGEGESTPARRIHRELENK